MASLLEYLTDLEGTEVTLDAVTEGSLHFPAQTWVIVKKLEENPCRLTQKDVTDGMGISDTFAKFLCRPAGPGNETKLAFMRIHQQVPIAGTEFKKTSVRAGQAVDEPGNRELIALKSFMRFGSREQPSVTSFARRFLQFGFMPLVPTPSKIIYDESSGQMHISGFRLAYRPEEPQEWEDHFFYRFALALPNRNPGALMPGISSNEEDWMEDENGCIW
ncbi:hypothetical protein LT330_008060 [Penicillium expansum]|nr:hypothetical protein LT330_008060 [Penicillium expansum]